MAETNEYNYEYDTAKTDTLENLFPTFHQPDFQESFYTDGKSLFVYDANLLLDICTFFEDRKREAALYGLRQPKHFFIPNNAAAEFELNFQNRLEDGRDALHNSIDTNEAIKTIKGKSSKIIKFLQELSDGYKKIDEPVPNDIETLLNELKKHNLKNIFDNSVPNLKDSISNKSTTLTKALKTDISNVISDHVGTAPTSSDVEKFEKEGTFRFDKKIAPGFNDNNKKDLNLTNFQGIEGEEKFVGPVQAKKFGDLFNWLEAINYLTKIKDAQSIERMIFVTNDGQSGKKKDFLNSYGDPLPELVGELWGKTKTHLYIIKNQDFFSYWSHNSEKYKDANFGSSIPIENTSASLLQNSEIKKSFEDFDNYIDTLKKWNNDFSKNILTNQHEYDLSTRAFDRDIFAAKQTIELIIEFVKDTYQKNNSRALNIQQLLWNIMDNLEELANLDIFWDNDEISAKLTIIDNYATTTSNLLLVL